MLDDVKSALLGTQGRLSPGAALGYSVALVMVAALLLLAPVLADPAHLALGSAASEAPAHLWGLWTTSDQLFEWGPYIRAGKVDFPVGFASDLIDPVSLAVFWPVYTLLGGTPAAATLAWNLLHLLTVLLAGWGGWRLARRLLPDPAVWPLVVAACAAAPYLMATPGLGRSEYLAGAWYPLHLSFLHAHLSPNRRRRDTLAAIATLVGLAHSGWALAIWVAALEIPIAWVFSRALPDRRARLARLAEVALPAILLCLPYLYTTLRLKPWWLLRLGPDSAGAVVLAVPLQNLVRFLPGTSVGGGVEVAPWPGTLLPVLALWGMWRRPREAAPWALLGLAVFVGALGPEVQWATPEGPPAWKVHMPVSWLMAFVPGARGIQNWTRLACLLSGLLGVAAAFAMFASGRKRSRLHVLACLGVAALVTLDHATWAWRGTDLSFRVALPADVERGLAKLPDGPILELPLDSTMAPGAVNWDDFSLLWYMQHRRPTSEAPSPTVASAYSWSVLARSLRDGSWAPSAKCASSESARLYNKGFRGVVFHYRRVPADRAPALARGVEAVLGPVSWRADDVAVWTVRSGAIAVGCEGPLGR